MKYFLWRFLRRRFWLKLKSHYESHGMRFYCEYQMRKKVTRNHYLYKLIGTPEGAVKEI